MKISEEQEKFLRENENKLSSSELASYLGCCQSDVSNIFKKLGIIKTIVRSKARDRLIAGGYSFLRFEGRYAILKCKYCDKEYKGIPNRIVSGRKKSCGCQRGTLHRKGTKYISATYFCKVRDCAKRRNITFDITIEQMEELLINQDFKCKLTGYEIVAGYKIGNQTASFDRIDSSKGYSIDNVQWIHKELQNMKWDKSEERFIELCKAIAEYN